MKCEAIVFDLFGTLVPPFSAPGHSALCHQMAALFHLPAESFEVAWSDAYPERGIGDASPADQTITISRRIGGFEPSESAVTEAMALRLAFFERSLVPRAGTVEVLQELRRRGLKLGLVSDCSCEAPQAWPRTALAPLIDVAVFSCDIGCHKPDPRNYLAAAEALGVPSRRCLYVGDGGSEELSGAQDVGMTAVLLTVPEEQDAESYLLDRRQSWTGATVSSLEEVVALIA